MLSFQTTRLRFKEGSQNAEGALKGLICGIYRGPWGARKSCPDHYDIMPILASALFAHLK